MAKRRSRQALLNDNKRLREEAKKWKIIAEDLHTLAHALDRNSIGCEDCILGTIDEVSSSTGEVTLRTCTNCEDKVDRFIRRYCGVVIR